MSNNKNKEKSNKSKVHNKNTSSKIKKFCVNYMGSFIVAVLFIVLAVACAFGAKYVGSDEFKSNMVLKLIPDTIETNTVDDAEITFYKETNAEYDGDEELSLDGILKMYNFYYLDEDGNKVYLQDGLYQYVDNYGTEQFIIVGVVFTMTALAKIDTIKNALDISSAVIPILGLAIAILIGVLKFKKIQKQQMSVADNKKKKKSHW